MENSFFLEFVKKQHNKKILEELLSFTEIDIENFRKKMDSEDPNIKNWLAIEAEMFETPFDNYCIQKTDHLNKMKQAVQDRISELALDHKV